MKQLIILFFFIIEWVFAQNFRWEDYVPRDIRFYPVVRIKIVVHILQKSDGTNNFQNTIEHKEAIKRILFHAYSIFCNLKPLKLGNSEYIPDSRIRLIYKEDDFYFHQNDKYNDLSCIGKQGTCGILMQEIYKEIVIADPKQDPNALHIFLGEGEEGKGEACGIGCKKWSYIAGAYKQYVKANNFWDSGALLAHEIGHNLGLLHTVFKKRPSNDYCDDTPTYPENPDCWNDTMCSNNMMDYNADKNALSACQLGRIHFFVSSKGQGDIKDAVLKDWCIFNMDSTVYLNRNEVITLNGEYRLQGNLVLYQNAVLTLNGTLHLPQNASIILYPNAKLIVNGTITNFCGDLWQGIFPAKSKKTKSKISEQVIVNGKIENIQKKVF